jgi:hypothetical protein
LRSIWDSLDVIASILASACLTCSRKAEISAF